MTSPKPESKITPAEFATLAHWSSYGRPGEPQETRAEPHKELKQFSKPETAPWRIILPSTTLERLILGSQAQAMENKWNVYTFGPDESGMVSVNMYRSWTGFKIIELSIETAERDGGGEAAHEGEGKGEAAIKAITCETDKEFYNGSGVDGAKETAREVCRWVMGVTLGPEV